MRLKEALQLARQKLADSGVERPLLEAEILLSHHSQKDRVRLKLDENCELESEDKFFALIDRRAKSEPIEYIIGRAGFYGREFIVYKGVLIPRPETEILVDRALEFIDKFSIQRVAEVGVGSGVISATLALERDNISIEASDISEVAISNTRANLERFNIEDRVKLHLSSMLDSIDSDIELLVSNPPYIDYREELESNVYDYEPHTALFSEDNGTAMLKSLIDLAITRGISYLICEMGYNQKDAIRDYLESRGVREYSFYKDYAGLDRGFCVINGH